MKKKKEKEGAAKTLFTKVKEELEFIPAQLNVLEYWQEKAVFNTDGEDVIVAAQRLAHPLGKCFASTTLLAYIITSKYADGLPLYRLAGMLKRHGGDISRSNMANWIVRLQDVFQPLINLIREVQLDGNYLQADGDCGYSKVCQARSITRIGCFDHARRRVVVAGRVPKGSLTHKAMTYTLNQWKYLTGYCEDGQLHISSVLAENAIRSFAVGRRAWLFADASHGARASATCHSLVETAKANNLEPYACLQHVLAHIAAADTVEKLEALLQKNMKTEG